MPISKSHHKKKTSYWFRKWLNKALIGLNIKKRRFQKPSSDIVFLTTKEVKESLSKATEREPVNFSSDSEARPELGILPEKNRSRRRLQNDNSLIFGLKQLLNWISFGVFKKKHLSSAHHEPTESRLRDHTVSAGAGFQKIKEDLALKETAQNKDQRHHHHRKQIHRSRFRKWNSLFMRKLKIQRKKSNFFQPLISENTENHTANQKKNIPWTKYIKPALTSTAMFMVTYQFSWFFYQLVVMITASFFGIDSVLYYYEVMFPVGSNELIWTPEKIIIITLSGPLTALLVWILLRFVLRLKSRYGSHFRMFLVWMYLISMMLFFGAFVGGAITLEGFGYLIDWLFMSVALRMILSLIFISMIIALSWRVVGYLPETTRSNSWKNNRHFYVLSRLVIPWLLGSGIMTLLKLTNNIMQHANIWDYDTINLVTLAFAVVPPLFNSGTRPQLNKHRKVNHKLREALPVFWIPIAIIVVVLFRIVLSYGIYFKLILNLDIYFYN
jgi:hypothetical protein